MLSTETAYNGFGEITAIALTRGGVQRHRQTFERDAHGELTAIERELDGQPLRWSYTFDLEGRLIRAESDAGRTIDYAYDPAGNRLTRSEGAEIEEATALDAEDRLLAYAGATFEHNAMGQRIGATDTPTGDWTYTYDTSGGLRRAQGDGIDVEYVLDAAGRRVARRVNGGPLTWWLYSGLSPIAELDADLRLTKVFVYGTRAHVPDHMITYADDEPTGRYRFVTDQVGSVLGVIGEDGAWIERTEYTPFGRIMSRVRGQDTPTHPFGFAGGLADETTGLVRFGARDFDPWTGRWTAKDPIGFAGGDGNLYGYVGNDPVRFFDPTGLDRRRWQGNGAFFLHAPTAEDRYAGDIEVAKKAMWLLEKVAVIAATGPVLGAARYAWRMGQAARAAFYNRQAHCVLRSTEVARSVAAQQVALDVSLAEAPALYGPFTHMINKGGLAEIVASGQLVSTSARIVAGGADAARAHIGASLALRSGQGIEFFTTVAPSHIGVGSGFVRWFIPEGEFLDILISAVRW